MKNNRHSVNIECSDFSLLNYNKWKPCKEVTNYIISNNCVDYLVGCLLWTWLIVSVHAPQSYFVISSATFAQNSFAIVITQLAKILGSMCSSILKNFIYCVITNSNYARWIQRARKCGIVAGDVAAPLHLLHN